MLLTEVTKTRRLTHPELQVSTMKLSLPPRPRRETWPEPKSKERNTWAGIEEESWAQVGSEEIPGSLPDGGPGHLAPHSPVPLILEGVPIPQAEEASTRVKE